MTVQSPHQSRLSLVCSAVGVRFRVVRPPPGSPGTSSGAAASRRQQAAARVAVMGSRAGSSSRQRSSASGHLGLNGQPAVAARSGVLVRCGPWRRVPLAPRRRRAAEVVGVRGRGDEQLRVRMGRLLGDLLGRAALHDLAGVHDQDLVGEVPGRGDVVGDVQHGQAEALAQVVEQVQHLEPDRDVQHGHRLVGQQHGRAGGQRPGERDPLALAAGQLVRVLDQEVLRRGEPHLFHQGGDLGVGVRALAVVQLQRALQVVAHGVHRVQRGERVLEDVLDLALVAAEIAAASHLDRLAVQLDRAGGQPFLPGQQPGGGGLARPALAHQRDHRAAVQVEGDVAHRVQRSGRGRS